MASQRPSQNGAIVSETTDPSGQPVPAVAEVDTVSTPDASTVQVNERIGLRGVDRTDPATAEPLTPKVLAIELWHAFFRTGVTGFATQFAYSLFFAISPLIVLIMSLAALVEQVLGLPVADTLRHIVDQSAPSVLQPVLREVVERAVTEVDTSVASISAVVATIVAVWGASGAIGTLVTACARAYGVRPKRPFPIRRLINVLLAVIIVILVVVSAALLIFGEEIGRRFGNWIGDSGEIEAVVVALRWGLVIVSTASGLLILYRIAPDLDLAIRWLIPGTAVATGLWLLILKGFSAVLQFTNPGNPYGAFGSLVVLLWFFYLTGLAFMLGAVVNAVVGRPHDERRKADIARHPEKRLFCDDGREM